MSVTGNQEVVPAERQAAEPAVLEGQSSCGQNRSAEMRRLSRPFWASFIIGAVGLLLFVTFMINALDRQSIRSSERIFDAVLSDKLDRLSELALEYGFWDSAVENLVDRLNLDWVDDNLVDYVHSELGIDGVHLIDENNLAQLHVVGGKLVNADLLELYGKNASNLIAKARQTETDAAPKPAVGFIGTLDDLYLASAVRMTTYDKEVNTSTDHVLLWAQALDSEALTNLETRYQLPGLHLASNGPGYWQASWPVTTGNGSEPGNFVWDPDLPGFRLLPLLTLGLLIVYAGMLLSARAFLRQATDIVHALAIAQQQSEAARVKLKDQVRRDALTGLGSRRYFDETIANLQTREAKSATHALISLDLDRFKEINDTLGHETGDRVLKHVADALRMLAPEPESIFRLGGDEFVIVFEKYEKSQVLKTGQKIVELLSRPLIVSEKTCRFGASVGIAFSSDISSLLHQADQALYVAKRNGRAQTAVYSPEMEERLASDQSGAKEIGTTIS